MYYPTPMSPKTKEPYVDVDPLLGLVQGSGPGRATAFLVACCLEGSTSHQKLKLFEEKAADDVAGGVHWRC